MRSRSLQLQGPGVASWGRAQVHPVRRAPLPGRLHRRSHRSAVRRAVRRRPRRARGAERPQHHPRRRAPGIRRARPVRAGRGHAAGVDRRRRCSSPTTPRRSRSTGCGSPTPPARDRDIVGVLGGLEVVDEGAGGVLPHERVTPKASTDRLDLTRSTRRQPLPRLGSVVGDRAHRAARRTGRADRLGHRRRCRAHRRTGHRPACGSMRSPRAIAADDVLIADGHHRYGISRTYRDERRQATGRRGRCRPRRRSPSSANSSPTS